MVSLSRLWPMRVSKMIPVLLLSLCFVVGRQLLAQGAATVITSPAIVSFTTDMATITMQDAEVGTKQTTLAWQVAGLAANFHLDLQYYSLGKWVSTRTASEKLPASGTRQLTVAPTLGFQPPTYRLVVLDGAETIVDQWTVSIAYTVPDTPPTLTFGLISTSVDVNDLTYGRPTTQVSWSVTNRPPTANLVFEQVLDDNTVVSIEQPRPALWIPSAGTGTVALRRPSAASQTVRLRARLIDVLKNTTYATQELTLPISGVLTAPPPTTVPATPRPTSGSGVVISFGADRMSIPAGACTTLSWQVTNLPPDDIVEFKVWSEPSFHTVPASGSQSECIGQPSGISGTNLFILRAANKAETRIDAEKRLEIGITAPVPNPQITFTVNPAAIQSGQCVTVTWRVTNLATGDTITVGKIGSVQLQHAVSGTWRDCPDISTGYYIEVERNGVPIAQTFTNAAVAS